MRSAEDIPREISSPVVITAMQWLYVRDEETALNVVILVESLAASEIDDGIQVPALIELVIKAHARE